MRLSKLAPQGFYSVLFPSSAVLRSYVFCAVLLVFSIAVVASLFPVQLEPLFIVGGASFCLLLGGLSFRVTFDEVPWLIAIIPLFLSSVGVSFFSFFFAGLSAEHWALLFAAFYLPALKYCVARDLSVSVFLLYTFSLLCGLLMRAIQSGEFTLNLSDFVLALMLLLGLFAHFFARNQKGIRLRTEETARSQSGSVRLMRPEARSARSEHEFSELVRAAQQVLHRELVSDYLYRLVPFCLVCAAYLTLSLPELSDDGASFMPLWAMSLCGMVFALYKLFTKAKLSSVFFFASTAFLFSILPVFELNLNSLELRYTNLAVLLIMSLFSGFLSLPPLHAFSLSSLLLLLIGSYAYEFSPLALLVCPLFLLISLRMSQIEYLNTRASGFFLVFSRALSTIDSQTLLRFLAWIASRLSFNSQSYVIAEGGLIVQAGIPRAESGTLGARLPGFFVWLEHLERDGGIIRTDEIPLEGKSELRDIVGTLPRQILFIRLEAVINAQSKKLFLVVPMKVWSIFVGKNRFFRILYSLTKLTQSKLVASQSQFRSSDLMSSLQKSLSEKERDFNEIVHQVNNFSQEALLTYEALREERPEQDEKSTFLYELSQASASYASDMKVLRDFEKLGRYENSQWVDAQSFADEVRRYASFYAYRKGLSCSFDFDFKPELEFRVVDLDFLHSALRFYCLKVSKSLGLDEELSFQLLASDENELIFCFNDSVRESALDEDDHAVSTLVRSSRGQDIDLRRVFTKLATMSSSSFRELKDETRRLYEFRFSSRLRSVSASSSKKSKANLWGLFVDDNPKVLKFYEHIGHALEVDFESCGSFKEASEMLESRGAPDFLVSDFELGDGFGVELMQLLESKNYVKTKRLIVSGNKDIDLGSLRGVRVLSKPISRKKLYKELKGMLFPNKSGRR